VSATLVREKIKTLPVGTWIRSDMFGGGNATEQCLSRLARDPYSPVVRAAHGLYFLSRPGDSFFGKQYPPPLATAIEYGRGRGVGPSGTSAVSFLGLTSQVPPRWSVCLVGSTPHRLTGVDWEVRNNPLRAVLNEVEIATLEMLTLFPMGVEVEWGEVVEKIEKLISGNQIDLAKLVRVSKAEKRKPGLQINLNQLLEDLS